MTLSPILLDSDGVLSDYLDAYRTACELATGRRPVGRVTSWDTAACLGVDKEVDRIIRRDVLDPITFSKTPWCDDFLAALKAVAGKRDIWCVTTPMHGNASWKYSRTKWLAHIGIYNVIHTETKHAFPGVTLIDDKTENIDDWNRYAGPAHPERRHGILFPATYNDGEGNWETVIARLEEVLK